MTESQQIAKLCFPNITKTPADWQKAYPPRNLPTGALVTRCAPSPTGYVHLGTFMQMIADTFLAHQSSGVSILRIEDTDDKRLVADAVDVILSIAAEYNVNFDEGAKNGSEEAGAYGPYFQSARKEIYQAFAKDLIARGLAYPCFCTREDEESMREKQSYEAGGFSGYFGAWKKCDKLTAAEVKQKIEQNLPFVVRFRAQALGADEKIEVLDAARGTLTLQRWYKDDVIIKSDGGSLYHLAHLVDDYLMGVNFVVRGSEWLSTYALHNDLACAMGITLPTYLHTTLLCKQEGESKVKLSKRKHPEANMSWFLQQGYPNSALFEYILTILDSNFEAWRKVNPSAALIEFKLTPSRLTAGEALFDINKLNDISKNIWAGSSGAGLYKTALNWAEKYAAESAFTAALKAEPEKWAVTFAIDRETERPRKEIAKLSDLPELYAYFLQAPKNIAWPEKFADVVIPSNSLRAEGACALTTEPRKAQPAAETIKVLKAYIKTYSAGDDKETWFNKIKALAETLGYAPDSKTFKAAPENYKGTAGDICQMLRIAVTGREQSVDLFEILRTLGEKEIAARLNAVM